MNKAKAKNHGQPRMPARRPDGGPAKIRPMADTAESMAYWVAVKSLLQSAIMSETKAAVPMPLERFSMVTLVMRRGYDLPARARAVNPRLDTA